MKTVITNLIDFLLIAAIANSRYTSQTHPGFEEIKQEYIDAIICLAENYKPKETKT